MATTRIRMTDAQKHRLLHHCRSNPEMLQLELCKWAANEFELQRPPSLSTLHLLLKRAATSNIASSGRQKTKHTVASRQLEDEVVRWVAKCERLCLPLVTGEAVRTKAAQIRDRILLENLRVANYARLAALVFPSGWLDKLKKRHGIRSRALHGEASSVSEAVVAAGRELLRDATRGYSKRDIFNVAETAYFYCTVPSCTNSKSSYAGLKQAKNESLLPSPPTPIDLSRSPLFVGTARQQRCFLGKGAEELGIQYSNAPKGWMTTVLSQRWLESFNDKMRDQKRNVLLLLDYASCHRTDNKLSNVRIHMLPSNTTAHLQPQDSGIIRAMKARIAAIKKQAHGREVR